MERTEHLACGLIELKFDGADAEAMTFSGYGAVFKNVDSYGDVIDPGAFAKYLADVKSGKQRRPQMLSQHGGLGLTADDVTPIGVWTELAEDGHGLKVSGKLADTPRGREIHTLMKMGALDGLSIGYFPRKFTVGTKPGEPRRKLHEIDLHEISPVTFPANGKARVGSVKSIEELASVRDAEEYLRERGFSKTESVALIARIKGIGPGDPVGAGGPGDPAAIAAAVASAERRNNAFAVR